MNFSDLINKRTSVRSYSDREVEKELILQCIEAARLSPSACNSQPWKFIIVDNPELLKKVAKSTYGIAVRFNKFVAQSKAIAVVVMEPGNISSKIGNIKTSVDYANIDLGIAVSGFCYQATDLGLGTCILGWFRENEIKKMLSIPKNKKIGLLISIGYPKDDKTRYKIRKPIDRMSSFNSY